MRAERQSNAYIEAAKAANLIPQDYEAGGVGGATLGLVLAKLIQEQNQPVHGDYYKAHTGLFGAQAEKERTIADYIKQYGTTPGRGTELLRTMTRTASMRWGKCGWQWTVRTKDYDYDWSELTPSVCNRRLMCVATSEHGTYQMENDLLRQEREPLTGRGRSDERKRN